MFDLLLFFCLAHFTTDFLIQTPRVIELKKTDLHKGLVKHTAIHLIANLLAAFLYEVMTEQVTDFKVRIIIAAVAIAIIHYFIDWLKENLAKKFGKVVVNASLFLSDQVIHIAAIFAVLEALGLVSYTFHQCKQSLYDFIFHHIQFTDLSKLLMILIIVILATQGAGYFLGIVLRNLIPSQAVNKGTYNISNEQTEIRTTFNEKGGKTSEITTIKKENSFKDSAEKIGRYIGMIERLLIIIFIVQGIPEGLTFLIAGKSFTRFKQFESKQFAEYYLIGTLLSALIAVVLGYVILRIL